MEEIKKTGYQWSLDSKIRLEDIGKYDIRNVSGHVATEQREEDYFEVEVTKEEFFNGIGSATIVVNSTPRKTEKYLEYRMYGLVPYNISDIQKGIQFGHAVVEYFLTIPKSVELNKWASTDKTFIILNGGTTNENKNDKFYGTLQQYRDDLKNIGVRFAEFKEPDLNNSLSAFVFLVDERVYDRELYPNFIKEELPYGRNKPSEKMVKILEEKNNIKYERWVEKLGGAKNVILRDYLKNFKLA